MSRLQTIMRAAILSTLSAHGAQDVSEAVRLFVYYSERIGMKAFEGKQAEERKASKSPKLGLARPRFSLEQLRRESVLGMR